MPLPLPYPTQYLMPLLTQSTPAQSNGEQDAQIERQIHLFEVANDMEETVSFVGFWSHQVRHHTVHG